MAATHPFHRRTALTLTVVIALLLAPSLAFANCCCGIQRLAADLGIGQSLGCDAPAVVATCCQAAAPASPAEYPTTVESGCSCDCASCSEERWDRSDVLAPSQDPPRVVVAEIALAALLTLPADDLLTDQRLDARSVSLSFTAPQRCATLCRWLN